MHAALTLRGRLWTWALLALVTVVGGLQPSAHALDYYWNAATGQWDTVGNWNTGSQNGPQATVPSSTTNLVYIANGGVATVGSGVTGNAQSLIVGADGNGTLAITAGGAVESLYAVKIGDQPNSSGSVTVSGNGSKLKAGDDISVGHSAGGSSALLAGTGKVIANGSGTAKDVIINSGGTLSAGDAVGEIGTLNIGTTDANETTNLVLKNGATLRVDTNSSANTADLIEVAGDVTVLNAVNEVLNIDLGSLDAVADVAIISAVNGGLLTADHIFLSNLNFTLNGATISLPSRVTGGASVVMNGNSLELTTNFSSDKSYKKTWTGATDNTWNSGAANWSNEGGDNIFMAGDWVAFTDSNGGDITVATGSPASQMDVTAGTWIFNGDLTVDDTSWKGLPATPTAADGKLHVSGASTSVTLNGDNSFAGGIDIAAGTLKVAGTLDGGNSVKNIANNGALVFDQTTNQTLSGTVTGSGSLTQSGAGTTLTLSGTNSYGGATTVAGGTLALTGSLTSTALIIGSGGTFDMSGAGPGSTAFTSLDVSMNSALAAGANTLDLSGGSITFDLDGANNSGDIIMTVSSGNLNVSDTTTVTLKNASSTLNVGAHIVLASAATGTASSDPVKSGRWKFGLEVIGGELLATITGLNSFVDTTNDLLGSLAPGNANIVNGGLYLDWLAEQPFGTTAGMDAIDNYFTDISNMTVPRAIASELERFYGAYSAYGNRALQDDANRFRRRWQRQNHFFLDGFVFSDLIQSAANAGVASDTGLASLRYGARECVPAGTSRVWAGGFGTWAKQDPRSGFAGYDYDSYGLALGYEYTRDRLRLGVAAAYSRGKLEVDDLGYENKPDVLNLALYGAYVHDSGFYAEGGLGYGHAWNDYRADMLLGGRKTAKYGSDIFSADLELGYIARLAAGYNLIPSLGLEYDYIRNDSWTEKVANSAAPANRFTSGHDHALDIPVGLRFNKAFTLASGSVIVPEVNASYVYTANKSAPTIQSGFAGAPGTATMRGVDPGRSHWRFGAGFSGQINRRVDFHVEYEFETRSGFKGHNLNASVGLSF